MATQDVRLGPWPLGLNWRDAQTDPSSLRPGELRSLVNLDPTAQGHLVARPGARKIGSPAMYTQLSTNGQFYVLGAYRSGLTAYAVVAAHDAPGTHSKIYYSDTPWLNTNTDWPEVAGGSLTGRFSTLVQYASKMYLVPLPSGGASGGQSTPSPLVGTWTAVAAMPAGDDATMIRERMFIVDRAASRIYWSKATDPTVWAAPDGGSVDVNPGDGEAIYAIAVINSQLYLFKGTRTYLLTFSADPALDGQLTLINDQLGGLDAKAFENSVLVLNQSGMWRLTNNYFARMDELAPVAEIIGSSVGFISAASRVVLEGDDTLVVATVNGGLSEQVMACNLRTGAWSVRRYPETALVPASRYAATRHLPGVSTAIDKPFSWNVYGTYTRVLVGSPIGPASMRALSTLDVTSAGAIVSPQYQMATGTQDGNEPGSYKRFNQIAVQLRNRLTAGDAAVLVRRYAAVETAGARDYDLDTARQSVAVPAGQWGGKPGLDHVRALAVGHALDKAATTLGAVSDPLTASDLTIRGMVLTVNPAGGSERT